MLKQLDRHLWIVQQPQKYFGLEVGTRMTERDGDASSPYPIEVLTVVLLSDRKLILVSPIKINRELRGQLDRLGEVKYIIAPNLFHYLYVEECQKTYPQAKLIAAPGLETKKPNLAIDNVFLRDAINFDGELEYSLFTGFRTFVPPKITPLNEVVFFHPDSKSLILTDTTFNFDRSFPFTTQLATRVIGSYGRVRPSWLEKIAIDREPTRHSVQKILAWDFQRVIMAHGSIVEDNAKERLVSGYQWLLDRKK